MPNSDKLTFKVLGRTLEHFGVQMYTQRPPALAELVANGWDAGAHNVDLVLPREEDYSPDSSTIEISDDGTGMTFEEVRDEYLVLGRNPREQYGNEKYGRRIMGRKGIGKLAGFGLAAEIEVLTWRDGHATRFWLKRDQLRLKSNEVKDIDIDFKREDPPDGGTSHGTIVLLSKLKHKTPIKIEDLCTSLARRFSRTVRGRMEIRVNGDTLPDPTPKLTFRFPEEGFAEVSLPSGEVVRYWYGFSPETIKLRELQGFIILVNGRSAQAPPFFFGVESTASGQHSTKYVIGEVEADFVDAAADDDSDVISTDRQNIDWEEENVLQLKLWGESLSRKVLAECARTKGEEFENWALNDPDYSERLNRLDRASKKQVKSFLRTLGSAEVESHRSRDLASSLLRAYEYRHFHDVVQDIVDVGHDPEALQRLLVKLTDWKVLESRAVLEVINGRLQIIDKFESMLANDAPERAGRVGVDNMHDLLARHPWILNPEWQILSEEKRITTLMRVWFAAEETDDDDSRRIDFLGLSADRRTVIIEIKRPDHAATQKEVSRLVEYKDKLSQSVPDEQIQMVLVCGRNPKITPSELKLWEREENREIRFWNSICEKTKRTYSHYRALLESDIDHPDFASATREVMKTREVIERGTVHRGPEEDDRRLGRQDIEYREGEDG
ncbi:ATP-binding protein [Stratiformator vulcanicus]|uniref:DNA mismatch repair protein n=1 Tax=Stratiformator vulcanicus TaxID=2527980 RepID=A0A517QYV1_9PLAN|nr:ATP-binding protein [Stratiformator vulcanicus]QDT36811.1 hypothetical protein Pan189_11740 [Stratiformator vulcanicus]